MKTISFFTAFLLCLIIGVFIFLNLSNIITLENSFLQLKVNVGFLILFASLIGSIITMLIGMGLGLSSMSKEKELKRKIEGEKLKRENESDRIKQLEAKVKTLEQALNLATKD